MRKSFEFFLYCFKTKVYLYIIYSNIKIKYTVRSLEVQNVREGLQGEAEHEEAFQAPPRRPAQALPRR